MTPHPSTTTHARDLRGHHRNPGSTAPTQVAPPQQVIATLTNGYRHGALISVQTSEECGSEEAGGESEGGADAERLQDGEYEPEE